MIGVSLSKETNLKEKDSCRQPKELGLRHSCLSILTKKKKSSFVIVPGRNGDNCDI